jgi:hypothetical protein
MEIPVADLVTMSPVAILGAVAFWAGKVAQKGITVAVTVQLAPEERERLERLVAAVESPRPR